MCMQDVIIGRKSQSSQLVLTTTTSSQVLLQADRKRFAIIISPPIANRITLSLRPTAIDQEGIVIAAGDEPLILTLKEHGDIVTRQITVIAAVAGSPIGVWYSTFDE